MLSRHLLQSLRRIPCRWSGTSHGAVHPGRTSRGRWRLSAPTTRRRNVERGGSADCGWLRSAGIPARHASVPPSPGAGTSRSDEVCRRGFGTAAHGCRSALRHVFVFRRFDTEIGDSGDDFAFACTVRAILCFIFKFFSSSFVVQFMIKSNTVSYFYRDSHSVLTSRHSLSKKKTMRYRVNGV